MKYILKPLFSLLLFGLSFSSLHAQDCNCKEAFDAAVQVYEENYSLFIYKVTDENRNLYNAHKNVMRHKAEKITDLGSCKTVLDQYLHFFRDGHTYILNGSKKTFYNETFKLTEKQFKQAYKKNNYHLNALLGIWTNGDYTVAIVPQSSKSKRERDFVGIVLNSTNPNWKPTDVKMELLANASSSYTVNFMMGDHSIRKTTGQVLGKSVLESEGLASWHKVWPQAQNQPPRNEIQAKFKEFHLSYIDGIPYLRLPDFYTVQRSFVDSIMKAHHNNILKAEFMIIDVRGNGGGNDVTYFPVLPYVLSGPIELPASGFWLSEYNIQKVMDFKTGKPGKKVEEYSKQEKEDYDFMMLNKGTAFFEYPKYSFTYKADTLYSGPRKIVLLTDKGTASSGETFVFRANQSNKVVVYGQNTAGVVDGFNGLSKDIGCFEVVFPSSYRAKDIKENPIDPYGIAPDVYVNEKVDVLNYAIEHMRQLLKHEAALK